MRGSGRIWSGLAAAWVLSGAASAPSAAGTAADWQVVWTGHGQVRFDDDGSVLLRTGAAKRPKETYSALVLNKDTVLHPLRNFRAALTVVNEAQLRKGTPHEWEVFWLFFNYNKPLHGAKTTNFVLLQTRTGLQLGRAFKEAGEVFLARPKTPSVPVRQAYALTVVKTGQHVEVLVDGKSVLVFDGGGKNGSLYDTPGSIGLYCEDSQVRVRDVAIEPLP